MVTVKGIVIVTRLKYLERYASPEQTKAVLERLPSALRNEIDAGMDPKKEIRFEDFVALNRLIDQEVGKGDLQLIEDQGRFDSADLMPNFVCVFRKFLSIHILIRKSIEVWNRLFSQGRLDIEVLEPGTYLHCLRMTLRDFGEPSLELGLMIEGVIRGALQMGGARESLVSLVDPPKAPGAELEILIQWSL